MISAYQVFTTQHPTMMISPCHERFSCARKEDSKYACSSKCASLKRYREALDRGFYVEGFGSVDLSGEYNFGFDELDLYSAE